MSVNPGFKARVISLQFIPRLIHEFPYSLVTCAKEFSDPPADRSLSIQFGYGGGGGEG